MNAHPCQSDVGQRLLDERADAELDAEQDARDLAEMAEHPYWLRKWHREDDSPETVWACCDAGLLLMLCDGLPCGDIKRADDQRDQFASLHKTLKQRFYRWATEGKPSYLKTYQEAERRAREDGERDE